MAQHRTIQVFTSTRITKKKSGEEERGTKWIQREKFPPIIQIAAWCLNPHHCSPHQAKSINQLEISEKLRTQSSPSSCSRYTIESWCGKAAHDSQSTMGKNNKNSTRRDSSKKNICNQETAPIYQTFAADPHHFCITGNSQVSYELHLALPFLGLAQTAESHTRTHKMPQ